MGRHVGKKLERKEKSKVKLRAKNAGITKAKNITDTTFKSHKILIREQLRAKDLDIPYSKRKLTVKELLSRLQHHNLSARQSALVDLRELVQINQSEEILGSYLGKIEEIAKLILDQEREVRKSAMKLMEEILEKVETQKLSPFFKMLLSYLGCSLTHIHPNIQEDGLLMLDVLLKAAPSLVAENACQILPSFLNMISRLKSESKPERTLTMNLGSTHLSMKWRFNVLCYMHKLLFAMSERYRPTGPKEERNTCKTIFVAERNSVHVPLYKSHYLKLCRLSDTSCRGDATSSSDTSKLKNFADVLMPLLIETWLEAVPNDSQQKNVLSVDTALLLKCMVEIIQLLWELLLLWEKREGSSTLSTEFASAYRKDFETHFLRGFPYSKANTLMNEWSDLVVKNKQPQKQKANNLSVLWKEKTVDENCSEINIALCILFCCLHDTENPPAAICRSVVEYTGRYMNTLGGNPGVTTGIMPLLRMLLKEHSKTWKWLEIDFAYLMDVVLLCSPHVRPPFAEELILMLCEIAVSKNLYHLHNSSMFLTWLYTLPEILLRPTVHVTMLKAVLELAYESEQFTIALHKTLSHTSAMVNLNKINVTGVQTHYEGKVLLNSILYSLKKQEQYQRGYWSDEAAISLAEMLLPQERAM